MLAWDAANARWLDDGEVAAFAAVVAARDALADDYSQRFAELVDLLTIGTITTGEWHDLFLALVLEAVAHGYIFGRGGVELMTDADWLVIAGEVNAQTAYAEQFVASVEQAIEQRPAGKTILELLQDDFPRLHARAQLYGGTVVSMYERGQVAAMAQARGELRLPVWPCDGQTSCKMRCRCAWHIVFDDEARHYRCTWRTMRDTAVCPECIERGVIYNPLIVPYAVVD